MNKKAFTLIELLAVIIILGVLAVIIAPKINNTIKEAEKNTHMTSIEGLIKTATYKYSNNDVTGKVNKNIFIDYKNNLNTNYLEYSGDKPEEGIVSITSTGAIALAIRFEDYCYIKNYESEDITVIDYNEATCVIDNLIKNENYTTGDAISYGGYDWHVISDDGENLTLLMDIGENGNYKLPQDISNEINPENGKMKHCTEDNDPRTDCDTNGTNHIYSWDKSLIQEYLNDTFYDDLTDKIGNELVEEQVCIDPSVVNTTEYSYGGYLKSEIDNINATFTESPVTCKNYKNYKVRLITTSEYINMSHNFSDLTLPYEGNIMYGNTGKIPLIPTITRITDNYSSWFYNGELSSWWSMSTYSDVNSIEIVCARYIQSNGQFPAGNTIYKHNVRPVITIKKQN